MVKRILVEKPRPGHRQSFRPQRSGKIRTFVFVLVALLTGLFSLTPDLHLDKILGIEYSWEFDMIQHGGYYFLLTLFIFLIYPDQRPDINLFALIFIASLIFEIIQIWVPDRSFSPLDLLSNFLGISLAYMVKLAFFRKRR